MEEYKYNIEYSPQYRMDLLNILYYIVYILENKYAADNLLKNINNAIMKRSNNPEGFEIYQSVTNRKYIWYRIYVGNYTIFYTIKSKKMIVARIFYSKRNFEELF